MALIIGLVLGFACLGALVALLWLLWDEKRYERFITDAQGDLCGCLSGSAPHAPANVAMLYLPAGVGSPVPRERQRGGSATQAEPSAADAELGFQALGQSTPVPSTLMSTPAQSTLARRHLAGEVSLQARQLPVTELQHPGVVPVVQVHNSTPWMHSTAPQTPALQLDHAAMSSDRSQLSTTDVPRELTPDMAQTLMEPDGSHQDPTARTAEAAVTAATQAAPAPATTSVAAPAPAAARIPAAVAAAAATAAPAVPASEEPSAGSYKGAGDPASSTSGIFMPLCVPKHMQGENNRLSGIAAAPTQAGLVLGPALGDNASTAARQQFTSKLAAEPRLKNRSQCRKVPPRSISQGKAFGSCDITLLPCSAQLRFGLASHGPCRQPGKKSAPAHCWC